MNNVWTFNIQFLSWNVQQFIAFSNSLMWWLIVHEKRLDNWPDLSLKYQYCWNAFCFVLTLPMDTCLQWYLITVNDCFAMKVKNKTHKMILFRSGGACQPCSVDSALAPYRVWSPSGAYGMAVVALSNRVAFPRSLIDIWASSLSTGNTCVHQRQNASACCMYCMDHYAYSSTTLLVI